MSMPNWDRRTPEAAIAAIKFVFHITQPIGDFFSRRQQVGESLHAFYLALIHLAALTLEQAVYIDGIETRAIVDSAAAVSILRCNEAGTVRDQHKRQNTFRVVVANSSTLTITGQKTVSITIDGVAVRHEFPPST